jgi:hypothetical protein
MPGASPNLNRIGERPILQRPVHKADDHHVIGGSFPPDTTGSAPLSCRRLVLESKGSLVESIYLLDGLTGWLESVSSGNRAPFSSWRITGWSYLPCYCVPSRTVTL